MVKYQFTSQDAQEQNDQIKISNSNPQEQQQYIIKLEMENIELKDKVKQLQEVELKLRRQIQDLSSSQIHRNPFEDLHPRSIFQTQSLFDNQFDPLTQDSQGPEKINENQYPNTGLTGLLGLLGPEEQGTDMFGNLVSKRLPKQQINDTTTSSLFNSAIDKQQQQNIFLQAIPKVTINQEEMVLFGDPQFNDGEKIVEFSDINNRVEELQLQELPLINQSNSIESNQSSSEAQIVSLSE